MITFFLNLKAINSKQNILLAQQEVCVSIFNVGLIFCSWNFYLDLCKDSETSYYLIFRPKYHIEDSSGIITPSDLIIFTFWVHLRSWQNYVATVLLVEQHSTFIEYQGTNFFSAFLKNCFSEGCSFSAYKKMVKSPANSKYRTREFI